MKRMNLPFLVIILLGVIIIYACKKELSTASPQLTSTLENNEHQSFVVEKGGYLNPEEGVHFEEADAELPMAFTEMFSHPIVIEALEDFYEENGLSALMDYEEIEGEEYYRTAVNIFGRRGILEVPESLFDDDSTILLALSGDAGSYTCDCTKGSCTFDKIMGIKYCSSDDCSGTCTLSSSNVIGEEIEVKVESVYKY